MPGREEIVAALSGAWELFLDRPGAMRHFDVSVEGFWRSFAAVALVLPSYAFSLLADRAMSAALAPGAPVEGGAALAVHGIVGLGIDWVPLPIILALLARPLGIGRHYAAFIVARNWGAVIAAVPFGLLGLLVVLGIIGAELGSTFMFAALVVVLRYNYLIARRALDASAGLAIGIVVLDFVVSLTLTFGLDAAFGAQ